VSPKPKRYAALYAAYLLGFDLTILAASLLLKFNVKKNPEVRCHFWKM
jgi:cytochrome c biogenesis protein CcdA